MMEGKTVLITGANTGIGKETARDLAKRGARVIMACRNMVAATIARDEIANESGNQNVLCMKLDLASLQSTRNFATEFINKESRLDVLIHNAGFASTSHKSVSVDGIETTVHTNHYGPFLLTHLLIDLLKKSAPARIIIVASSFYRVAYPDLNKHINPVDSNPWYLYYVSKGMNIMFSTELAKRLVGTNVTANCLHPGMVDSGIWRNVGMFLKPGLYLWNKMMFVSPVEGARTSIYLATSEEVEGVTGKYFQKDCREATLRDSIVDPDRCLKLWTESARVVKLQPSDPQI